MKKVVSFFTVLSMFSILSVACAQEKDTTTVGEDLKEGVNKTGKAIGKGAKKVGNKTAEIASKGKSKVIDKVYEGKVGPNGQTIYINNESKYYWVDKKGHHVFISSSKLKDKTD